MSAGEGVPGEWRDMSKTCFKVELPASLVLACSCQLGGEAEGADLAEEAKEKLALWPLPLPPPSSSLLVRP